MLVPRFDEKGEVIAYERTMDPRKLEVLKQDKHMGRMLGVWSGRIVEENLADEANKELIDALKKTYDADFKAGRASEYVNVADKKLTSNDTPHPALG